MKKFVLLFFLLFIYQVIMPYFIDDKHSQEAAQERKKNFATLIPPQSIDIKRFQAPPFRFTPTGIPIPKEIQTIDYDPKSALFAECFIDFDRSVISISFESRRYIKHYRQPQKHFELTAQTKITSLSEIYEEKRKYFIQRIRVDKTYNYSFQSNSTQTFRGADIDKSLVAEFLRLKALVFQSMAKNPSLSKERTFKIFSNGHVQENA